uniref:GAG-pre-integrase domain-containing protein n=1 Tax=Cajanus cajan TaxID=3821 RepID=A0A151S9W1_CAJCA|nr:hypothetical protein KK1_026610 [Cajanus cajan]
MQDHTSRTLIGACERKDGLYWYRGVSGIKVYQINAEDQLEIWHQRMGHPAYQIVEKISNVSSGHRNKNTNQTCEVCERSKQSRKKFPFKKCL